MLGERSPQRELFRPDHALLAHVGPDSFYGFMAREGQRVFRDRDFEDLYGERGRPSVPPSQLCVLLVLQAKEGVSDQEAVDRTAFDLRWKVALGVELEEKLCAKSTLQLFRAKLLLNERYREIFEASVAACRRQGLGQARKLEVAIDTTPVLGHGAVRDTFNLVSDGIRRVVREACRLKAWDEEQAVAQNGLERHFGSSFKGECNLDWTDESERRALLKELVAEARVALGVAKKALSGHAASSATTEGLRSARALLADLLSQDIDEDPEDGGGPKIRKGTARDRVVSTSDPEMRHGHKSHSKRFEGYQVSVVAETDSGVILATDARAANVADREGARRLVESAARAAGRAVETVLGDTAYGDMGTRRELEECGAEVIAKAPPISSRKGTFGRDEFKVSERRGKATCPAGKSSIRKSRKPDDNGWTYHFSRLDCTPCPLRERCTTSKLGARTISVSAGTEELDRHRRRQKTERFRKRYRKRVVVEHAIGRLRRLGIGKARYFGTSKVAMQIALAAMAANLMLAASCPHQEGVMRVLLGLAVLIGAVALVSLATLFAASGRPLCRPVL